MVASRPSTIALADEVVYLVAGEVVDHGRHGELMARQPGYRALVEAFETDRRDPDLDDVEDVDVLAGGGGGAGG
jgi:ATP-binding cassette subfamily B protein